MIINLNLEGKHQPIYITLYETIKNNILTNAYKGNTKLPSIRSLSITLNISKNTVLSAYEQLVAEGYIYSKEKSGYYISDISSQSQNSTLAYAIKPDNNTDQKNEVIYDFRSGQIDLAAFPIQQFKKSLTQSINIEKSEILGYGSHQGDDLFREEISKYLYHSRGVSCHKDQIILSSGTQHLIQLLSLLIKDYGSHVAFENPGYVGSKEVFEHMNYTIAPIDIDEEGIRIDQLKKTKSSIAYVTPSHQFPTGVIMPIKKRFDLLNWAKETNGLIIEDDYDSEFRFKGQPIPSLHSLDNDERVIYIGTFSKSLMPSLRISYMVVPPKILNIYYEKYAIYEQSVPRVLQETMTNFIKDNHWSRHLKKMRTIYRRKQDELIQSLQEIFMDKVKIYGSEAGLHLLIEVKSSYTRDALIAIANQNGIALNQMNKYYFKNTHNKKPIILIGFAGIPLEQIKPAVQKLYTAWF